jgi:hypothetical protein
LTFATQEYRMPVKVFTLEEANRLLPSIEEEIRRLQGAVREIVRLQDALAVLQVLGGDEEHSLEHSELREKQARLESLVNEYNDRLVAFQSLGVVMKDINHGVVDFYGLKDGRLIFLCWRMGERAIGFWHEINSGMVGRRPVTDL